MNRKQRRAQDARLPVPDQATSLFAAALANHQAGRAAEAAAGYRRLLARDPDHAPALHLLAVLSLADNDAEAAARLSARAVSSDPGIAHAHLTLGRALDALGRPDEAARALRDAVRLAPDQAEPHATLGLVLLTQGRADEAAGCFRAATRLQPADPTAWSHLGRALRTLGRLDDALAAQHRAIALRPDLAALHFNLGNTLREAARPGEAIAAWREAVRRDPGLVEAHLNLGNTLAETGQPEQAEASFRTTLRLAPEHPGAHLGLGTLALAANRPTEALAACDAALRAAPGSARAHSNRGTVLLDLARHEEADAAFAEALRLSPDHAEAWSNRIMLAHYRAGADPAALLADYAARFETAPFGIDRPDGPDPDPRIAIGYVSGDLGFHPVGRFLLPVLAHHDRGRFRIVCYSNRAHTDSTATALRGHADLWREIAGLPDQAVAQLIANDRIDILVDLSGHTALNRLTLFARRAAPVQLSWLGYWDTTGLTRMDGLVTDAATLPPGQDAHVSETRILRLAGSRFCYAPPENAPPPAPPPCLSPGRGGRITFGSFNSIAKLSPQTIRLWTDTLRAVPGSRLVLKWKTLADPSLRASITARFAEAGLDPARLELRPGSPHAGMLAEYADIDIALDPHPFSGGMTSCDALWMGVPVLTLPGRTAASRQTTGFLEAIGVPELIAADAEDYVRRAAGLALGPARLALRSQLRHGMDRSGLCSGTVFMHSLNGAYDLPVRGHLEVG